MRTNAEELLNELEQNGAILHLRGDRLVVNAPKGLLTPEDKDELKQSKPALMKLLSARKHLTERNSGRILKKQGTATLQISAEEFLAKVTQGLRVGVTELLRLGIITPQDISDLENGMYGYEHVDAYRALVEQQLTLGLASGGKDS